MRNMTIFGHLGWGIVAGTLGGVGLGLLFIYGGLYGFLGVSVIAGIALVAYDWSIRTK